MEKPTDKNSKKKSELEFKDLPMLLSNGHLNKFMYGFNPSKLMKKLLPTHVSIHLQI
ncbi:hypothetical protein [Flavobacterium sp. K5-23]|uniref:hypothetical protein n=1 Tax=Flavobacterium sp. K5-23 TaxID=2746225 RepID=UPI00200C0FBE|nr:hypothetical protein [Flavobacterium sp. K5-23]UQD56734.1 hypothetical protein FLAK523_10175 [Flavobacterium sp. K5-23]